MEREMGHEPVHRQHLFISHASGDKREYIVPLTEALVARGVSFWLDDAEIRWGDSIALKINEGLRESRFILLCLSLNFLSRPWPEAEMNSALMLASTKHPKRVLPLILNSKEEVLRKYPLVAGLSYREFSEGAARLAEDLSALVGSTEPTEGKIRVTIESIHSGQVHHLLVSPRVSVKWLEEQAKARAGVRDSVDVGALNPFRIRWVLVDSRAEPTWKAMEHHKKMKVRAIVQCDGGTCNAEEETVRLETIGVYDGIVFHLYAVQDGDLFIYNYRPDTAGPFGGGFAA
jgi:hypothetical protein